MLPMEVIEKFTTLEAEVDRLKSENDKLRGLLHKIKVYFGRLLPCVDPGTPSGKLFDEIEGVLK